MKCESCQEEFVGRYCPKCGTLPGEETEKTPDLHELLSSQEFVDRRDRKKAQ